VTHVVAVALDPAHEVADPAQDPDLAPDRVLDHEEVHVTDVTADRAADHALDLDPARLLAPLAQNYHPDSRYPAATEKHAESHLLSHN